MDRSPSVLTQETALCQRMKRLRVHFLNQEGTLRASLPNTGSHDGESTPKRKDMDKLEFRQWAYVTRFKNWQTPFWREVITGSTHPRQVTHWLSAIHQATSTQDLDGSGSAFSCTRMQFETLGSQIAEGFSEDRKLRVQERKFKWPKKWKNRKGSRC